MKITADTNVLVRAIVRDEPVQAAAAEKILCKASSSLSPCRVCGKLPVVILLTESLPMKEPVWAVKYLSPLTVAPLPAWQRWV